MKYFVLLLVASFLLVPIAISQQKRPYKDPTTRNHKLWKRQNKQQDESAQVIPHDKLKTGDSQNPEGDTTLRPAPRKGRHTFIGPVAKNLRAWKSKRNRKAALSKKKKKETDLRKEYGLDVE